jgi:hypothetical protein
MRLTRRIPSRPIAFASADRYLLRWYSVGIDNIVPIRIPRAFVPIFAIHHDLSLNHLIVKFTVRRFLTCGSVKAGFEFHLDCDGTTSLAMDIEDALIKKWAEEA